eukprot:1056329_1
MNTYQSHACNMSYDHRLYMMCLMAHSQHICPYNLDCNCVSSMLSITLWNFIASPMSPSNFNFPDINNSAGFTFLDINFMKLSSDKENVHVGSSTPPLIIFLFAGSMHHTLV